MEIAFTPTTISFATIIMIFAKWYHDHLTIGDIKSATTKKEKRLKYIEDELIKIVEALERTYTTGSYVDDKFYDKDDIDLKLEALKEQIKVFKTCSVGSCK